MFEKILIANRGEIALRVIRACREMGIRSVAVYSEADKTSLHRRFSDEAVCIGPGPGQKSYLNQEAVLDAARQTGAQAVHPGYGYLAENAQFARACEKAGLVFIGPPAHTIDLAGNKLAARKTVQEAGVPVIPATGGVEELGQAKEFAEKIGYPVMLKAAAGGGGRGIRVCKNESILEEEFAIARAEATAAFGDGTLYLEKHIVKPRHVEFQVLADGQGNMVHLFERECSIQRRFQKLVEEAPSPALTPALREKMGAAAIDAARATGYVNAGTVEFLLDADKRFYFLEINSRIQVEHPVTEWITGVDMVKEQINIAAGQPLAFWQNDLAINGWAMECRINAEDPDRMFLPSPGTVENCVLPGGYGVRLDTHLYSGYKLPVYYDSLVAKLSTHNQTRQGAIAVMRRALEEFVIEPVKTTIPLHMLIMDDPDFISGDFDTSFITRFVPDEEDEDEEEDEDDDED